jgi:hypothetical protein
MPAPNFEKIPRRQILSGTPNAARDKDRGINADVHVEAGWRFVGYDVADEGNISGLSNCGYTELEAAALRPAWASKLNEHGLFLELDVALAFRSLTDQRVVEHAPFFVNAIWIVEPVTATEGRRR